MSIKQATSSELCGQLSEGWTVEHPDAPRELLVRLCARWQAEAESETPGASTYRAVLELSGVHLLGASALGCLILGCGASVEHEVTEFWQRHCGSGRLTLILAATASLRDEARRAASTERCLFLGNDEIEALLSHAHPLELLKEHFRRQIPLRRLLPYDIKGALAHEPPAGYKSSVDFTIETWLERPAGKQSTRSGKQTALSKSRPRRKN